MITRLVDSGPMAEYIQYYDGNVFRLYGAEDLICWGLPLLRDPISKSIYYQSIMREFINPKPILILAVEKCHDDGTNFINDLTLINLNDFE